MFKIIKKFSTFIEANRFKDDMLLVYKSTESRNIKIMNVVYLFAIGYNCYSYYSDYQKIQLAVNDLTIASYKSSMENSSFLALVITIGMGIFNWKTHKTLKSVWLQKNGKSVIVETHSIFNYNLRNVEVSSFKGFRHFIHPSLKIPVLRIGKQNLFFKHQYILDEEIMRSIIQGKELRVSVQGMEKELSMAQKKKYGL